MPRKASERDAIGQFDYDVTAVGPDKVRPSAGKTRRGGPGEDNLPPELGPYGKRAKGQPDPSVRSREVR